MLTARSSGEQYVVRLQRGLAQSWSVVSRHPRSGSSSPAIHHPPSFIQPIHITSSNFYEVSHQTVLSYIYLVTAFTMKTALALAGGAALAGTAHCGGVHTMKLQKIPLSEQLAHADIVTHGKALYQKYAGQQFMGNHPESHKEEMFKDTSIHLDGDGHPVPVSNFLNAQCEII